MMAPVTKRARAGRRHPARDDDPRWKVECALETARNAAQRAYLAGVGRKYSIKAGRGFREGDDLADLVNVLEVLRFVVGPGREERLTPFLRDAASWAKSLAIDGMRPNAMPGVHEVAYDLRARLEAIRRHNKVHDEGRAPIRLGPESRLGRPGSRWSVDPPVSRWDVAQLMAEEFVRAFPSWDLPRVAKLQHGIYERMPCGGGRAVDRSGKRQHERFNEDPAKCTIAAFKAAKYDSDKADKLFHREAVKASAGKKK
jgi:hypothetical protein